jgi:hypothetical protein
VSIDNLFLSRSSDKFPSYLTNFDGLEEQGGRQDPQAAGFHHTQGVGLHASLHDRNFQNLTSAAPPAPRWAGKTPLVLG